MVKINLNCYEKELQKTNQTKFRIEEVIKRKDDKIYAKWKVYDNLSDRWIYKKILLYKMSYIPEPYTYSKSKIRVEMDFSRLQQSLILKAQQVLIHQTLLKRLI